MQISEDPMKERYADPKLKIFALNSNRPLAQKLPMR